MRHFPGSGHQARTKVGRVFAAVAASIVLVMSSANVATAADRPSLEDSTGSALEEPRTPEKTQGPEKTQSPQSVPSPGSDSATITVDVGGTRTASSTVSDLEGVTLRLYDGGREGPSTALSDDWATCTSDSDGDCSFIIPMPKGECTSWERQWIWDVFPIAGHWEKGDCNGFERENEDRRFWVKQESAPQGWTGNDSLFTGNQFGGSPDDYVFRTGSDLEPGKTYRSGDDFMASGTNGVWQESRNNNRLDLSCSAGLDVALVLDLSGSVADAGAEDDLKESAAGMVDALDGTGSTMALYTFATDAPRSNGASGKNWPATDIDTHADEIKDHIDDYAADGGTNWDRGLWQVARPSEPDYDLVVVVTDGMPTYFGTGSNRGGSGSSTRFAEVEEAIFSANAIKDRGARMLAVGVGSGISSGGANLSAISGPVGYSAGDSINDADYFQAGWSELAPLLTKVAQGATCQATLDITKKTLAYGDSHPESGGSGWKFHVAATNGTLSPSAEQTTGTDSTVSYEVKFDDVADTTTLSIDEILSAEQKAQGWALTGLTCTTNGEPIGIADIDEATVDAASGDAIECTATNEQSLVPNVEIVKKAWDTPSADGLDGATELPPGATVADGSTITWTYLVTNTGQTDLSDITVGDDQLAAEAIECSQTTLAPQESMTCTASGQVTD